MIPTLILFGLIFGRWWRLSLVVAAVGWPALLVAGDIMYADVGLVVAAGLAIVNTEVGVLIHQGLLQTVRLVGHPHPSGRAG